MLSCGVVGMKRGKVWDGITQCQLVTLLHFDQFIYCIASLLQQWNSELALELLLRHSSQSENNSLSLLLRQTEIRRNKLQ